MPDSTLQASLFPTEWGIVEIRSQGDIYDASRSKMSGSTRGEKCPKTNLESQDVLCEAYTCIVVYIIYCAQMAHIQGVNVPRHSKTGL